MIRSKSPATGYSPTTLVIMRDTTNLLISGASVAGPALAYWLHRHGLRTTIVERAQEVRPGGHLVDFRGTTMRVLDRMGILDAAGSGPSA